MAAPPASATAARCPSPSRRRSRKDKLVAAAVLSGNRNFEGRMHPQVRANYLASPPLVVAYALAGTVDMDLANEPLGKDRQRDARLPARHLALAGRNCGNHEPRRAAGDVPQVLRKRLGRQSDVERHSGGRRRALRVAGRVHLHSGAAVFHRDLGRARAHRRDPRRARAGAAGRFGHHGPHFARRRHSRGQPGGRYPDGARRDQEAISIPSARGAATIA